MGLIYLTSDNPNFSFCIGKNPASRMLIKHVRRGVAQGFYAAGSINKYVVFFRDPNIDANANSYARKTLRGNVECSYVNETQYTSAEMVINLMEEFFRGSEEHEPSTVAYSFFINCLPVTSRILNIIGIVNKSWNNIHMDVNKFSRQPSVGSIMISSRSVPLKSLLSAIYVFCSLVKSSRTNSSDAIKLAKCMQSFDHGYSYHLRYLISSRLIFNRQTFRKFVGEFANEKIIQCYGNTAQQRQDFIKKQVDFQASIIDYGCGTGNYIDCFSKALTKHADLNLKYYAFDIDEKALLVTKRLASVRKNVVVFSRSSDLFSAITEPVDVICSEVVEHMSLGDCSDMLHNLVNQLDNKLRKLIITTPNAEFNQYYCDVKEEDEKEAKHMRHHDHHWEMNTREFEKFMTTFAHDNMIIHEKFYFSFHGVGDSVDGNFVTQCAIFSRK